MGYMELVDIVNNADVVIGTANKTTAHANRLLHRAVAVYVFNEAGELYVQVHKASGGRYDNSIGGHVKKGEDYVAAAAREANEELGISQPLSHLITFYSQEIKFDHMFGLFECVANTDWQFIPTAEVDEIIPMKLDAIRRLMHQTPERFTGGFINTMQVYCKVKNIPDLAN